MTTDIDIYRSAQQLIERYGEDAPVHAAMLADRLLDRGDLDGRLVWLRVLRAIGELDAEPAGLLH